MNLVTFGHKEMDKTPSMLQQRLVEVRVKEPVDLEVCNTEATGLDFYHILYESGQTLLYSLPILIG